MSKRYEIELGKLFNKPKSEVLEFFGTSGMVTNYGFSDRFEWQLQLIYKARIDRILHRVLPNLRKIYPTRAGGEADAFLSIDFVGVYPDREELWALKCRENKYLDFEDVTIELINGDGSAGDWKKFQGGQIRKYIYGWANEDEDGFKRLLILDAKKLVDIPYDKWGSNFNKAKRRRFLELGIDTRIRCKRNRKYGRSWFTAIALDEIPKNVVLGDTEGL